MKLRLWQGFAVLAAMGVLAAAGPTAYTLAVSAGRVSSPDEVPPEPVAIVFGAGLDATGVPMPFLSARLDLAVHLYRAGTVTVVLVSGDNRTADYNEPDAMRAYLVGAGVPADRIVADYAGRDTYSTCMRAKRIFGVDEAVLVSQSYHLPRAVTACRGAGIDAWAVGDATVSSSPEWPGYVAREAGANIKLAWDLLSQRQPILGSPESGVRDALEK